MFKVLILVCAMEIHPPDCSEDTALHVLIGPDCVNEIACARGAQAFLAGTEIGRSLKDHGYFKTIVTRKVVSEASTR